MLISPHENRTTRVVRSLLVASALASVIALAGLAAWVVGPDQAFIKVVEFEGASHASHRALRHLADVHRGDRFWEVDEEDVSQSVERHPWVAEAEVEVVWPDTVRVNVVERRPLALLLVDGALHYVDRTGHPFLQAPRADAGLPVFTGVGAELQDLHPDLPGLVVRSALALTRDLDQRGLVSPSMLSGVHFSRSRGFTVTAGNAQLVFGLERQQQQLDRLDALLQEGVVDLSRPLHVDLVPQTVAIVRERTTLGDG